MTMLSLAGRRLVSLSPPFFAGSVPSVIQLIVMSIRIVAVVMAEAASSCTQPTATDTTTTGVVTSMQRPRCR